MSIQWTMVSSFLYMEIGIIFILLLSIVKPEKWRRLFKSHFLEALSVQFHAYLYVLIGILMLFFGDSIREFHRYSQRLHQGRHETAGYVGSVLYHEDQMRLFHGQRNFYISGFALFALFVIKRLVHLISSQGQAKLEAKACQIQAQNLAKHLEDSSLSPSSEENVTTQDAQDDEDTLVSQAIADAQEQIDLLMNQNDQLKKQIEELTEKALCTNENFQSLTQDYKELQSKYSEIISNKNFN